MILRQRKKELLSIIIKELMLINSLKSCSKKEITIILLCYICVTPPGNKN